MATIYAFFADAEESSGLPRSEDTDRWRRAVRQKCGMPTAHVELVKQEDWESPELQTVEPPMVMAKQESAIRGIRKALSERGVPAQDIEVALLSVKAIPIEQTGRVLYTVSLPAGDVPMSQKTPGDPQAAELPRARERKGILSILRDFLARVFAYSPEEKGELLRYYAEKGKLTRVRHLLSVGADVDSADEFGATPLIKACLHVHEEVVAELVCAGADVTKSTQMGRTSLHILAGLENTVRKQLEQLLEKARAKDARDCRPAGQPWDFVISEDLRLTSCLAGINDSIERIGELLLKAGANSDARNAEGRTPLDISMSGLVEKGPLASLLLERARGQGPEHRCQQSPPPPPRDLQTGHSEGEG